MSEIERDARLGSLGRIAAGCHLSVAVVGWLGAKHFDCSEIGNKRWKVGWTLLIVDVPYGTWIIA